MKRILAASIAMAAVLLLSGVADAGGKPDGATCHVHKSCRSKLCLRENPLDKFGKCCGAEDCASLGAQCGEIDNGCGTPIQCGDCGPGSNCVSNQCVQGSTTTSTTSTTATTSSTTTTNTLGCGFDKCDAPVPCANTDSCQLFDIAEDICGVCVHVTSNQCGDYTTCTQTSDCSPGEHCATGTCCETGICMATCPFNTTTTTSPPTTTSTTSTTTTTAAPPTTTTLPVQNSCAGHCGGGAGAPDCYPFFCDCYCDSLGCGTDNCADVDTECPGTCTPPTTVPPTTTTTTTSTTSTTIPELPKSCVGYCGQFRTVPPGSGPDCYCDSLACSFNNNDGCADFVSECSSIPVCVD